MLKSGRRMRLRAFSFLAAGAVILTGLAACSSDGNSSATSPKDADTVQVTHQWGTTAFPVKPKRVVAEAGYALDDVLALGVQPVAYIGSSLTDSGAYPWEKVDASAVRIPMSDKLPLEQIAAQKPDLIVLSSYTVTDKSLYDSLSAIAPTLAGTQNTAADAVGDWRDQLTKLGQIFDEPKAAADAIAADKARVEKVASDLPGLRGKTAVVAQYLGANQTFNLVADQNDPANQLFVELGMTLPKTITSDSRFSGRTPVSLELLPLLNADFMAIYPAQATAEDLAKLPGYSELTQVKTGATNVMTLPQIVALNTPSSLSRAWVLDLITPQLKIAAAG